MHGIIPRTDAYARKETTMVFQAILSSTGRTVEVRADSAHAFRYQLEQRGIKVADVRHCVQKKG